mmetsp:Transcript_2340/g.2206  ORF Transcript_2340/g.2206 Transcript_2340/m.2206 type:complete len:84 (-) Transcript_2340:68-319(-)
MRFLQKKISESGIANANIFISEVTLQKITERLLQSDSMGPDQKRVNNLRLSLPTLKVRQADLNGSVPLGTKQPDRSFNVKIRI